MEYEKYLKYKTKYLELKEKFLQLGGAFRWIIDPRSGKRPITSQESDLIQAHYQRGNSEFTLETGDYKYRLNIGQRTGVRISRVNGKMVETGITQEEITDTSSGYFPPGGRATSHAPTLSPRGRAASHAPSSVSRVEPSFSSTEYQPPGGHAAYYAPTLSPRGRATSHAPSSVGRVEPSFGSAEYQPPGGRAVSHVSTPPPGGHAAYYAPPSAPGPFYTTPSKPQKSLEKLARDVYVPPLSPGEPPVVQMRMPGSSEYYPEATYASLQPKPTPAPRVHSRPVVPSVVKQEPVVPLTDSQLVEEAIDYIFQVRNTFNSRVPADPQKLYDYLNEPSRKYRFNNQEIRMDLIHEILSRSRTYKRDGETWID